MKKRIGALLLAAAMVLSLVPMTAVEVKAADTQAEGADFISRSDGVWLFPMDKYYYNCFSDWAGCPGAAKCVFHGEYHSSWGDSAHTSNYKGHNGFDVGASTGTSVYAAADGTAYAEYNDERGYYVIIEHPIGDGWSYFSYYQHLSSCSVTDGTQVSAGDIIGKVGDTGYSEGSHLHFGIVLGHNKSYTQLGTMEGKGWVLTEGLQEGRILVNPALNSPAGFPTGASEVVPPLKAHAGSVMYTFDKSAVDIGESAGIDECEEFYPSWCEIEITSLGAYVKSLPCSKDTNPDSADIEQPAVGTTYTTNGLCLNSAGNYWYRVTAKTGEIGYVYSGNATVNKEHFPYLSGEILPETVSGATWLGGTVINGGCEIKELRARVFEGSVPKEGEDNVKLSPDWITVNTTGNYSLYMSDVDKSVLLQNLSDGYYTIAIEAHVYNYFVSGSTLKCRERTEMLVGYDCFVYGTPAACSHSYSSEVTEPTCTEDGYTTYTCTKCGYSYKGDETESMGHDYYLAEEVGPTCTEDGYVIYQCSRCDKSYQDLTFEFRFGHDYYWYVQDEPSFDEIGCIRRACSRCSDAVEAACYLPSLNTQDYDYAVVQAPSCTEDGIDRYTWKTTEYGEFYFDIVIPALGHNFTDYKINVVPTADQNGSIVRTCSRCDDSHVVYLPVLNTQDYDVIYLLEPTCTANGAGEYIWKVTDYGIHSFLAEIPAIGHNFTDYEIDVVPTADQNGSIVRTCSRCDDSHVVYLPVLNTQNYDYSVVQEPTYAQEGIGRYTWKVTDYGTYSFDVAIDKLEEKVTEVFLWLMPSKLVYEIGEELDPTGLKLQVTYNSGRRATVNAGDEGLEISGFDSSSAGEKTVTVTYAGYSVSFEVTVEESEEPEPDPDAPQIVVSGARVRAGETFTVDIAVKNNPGIASMKLKVILGAGMFLTDVAYNEEIGGLFTQPQTMDSPVVLSWVSAFEDAEGDWVFATLTFTMAESVSPGIWPINITYDPEDLYDMTETNIEFAVQTGIVEVVEYIPGDINGDGKVNNKDATRLLQYLAEWDVEVVEAALDVNGDGKVNNKDATRLLQYLAEWDVEIH